MPKNFLQSLEKETPVEKTGAFDAIKKKEPVAEPKKAVDKSVEKVEKTSSEHKFFILSTYGELLDVAIQLKEVEGQEVVLMIGDHNHDKIGDGIIDKAKNWHDYLGQDYIFLIDGCENARLQEWLREQGEFVIGTNTVLSDLENDRQKGQDWFKEIGFKQPESKNFTNIDDAIKHVTDNIDTKFILKQNGDAPKHLNHMSKFDGNEDMLLHLNDLKKKWSEAEYGPIDFDLMEIVEGTEVAASAFFNGTDWIRNSAGKAICYLNFEEKKENDGNQGETTGETGTTFYGCDESNPIAKEVLFNPKITAKLKETGYVGVFDINGSLTEKGFVGFEPTSRFGIPATSYEFIEGLRGRTADLLVAMATANGKPIDIKNGWGMVLVISAKPYPLEADVEESATSIGEKLWILDNGTPTDDFTEEQLKHIHLENFHRDDEGDYRVATKSGYLLTVTGRGGSIENTREMLHKYIKDNLYISGFKHRHDIGARVENEL